MPARTGRATLQSPPSPATVPVPQATRPWAGPGMGARDPPTDTLPVQHSCTTVSQPPFRCRSHKQPSQHNRRFAPAVSKMPFELLEQSKSKPLTPIRLSAHLRCWEPSDRDHNTNCSNPSHTSSPRPVRPLQVRVRPLRRALHVNGGAAARRALRAEPRAHHEQRPRRDGWPVRTFWHAHRALPWISPTRALHPRLGLTHEAADAICVAANDGRGPCCSFGAGLPGLLPLV